MNPLTPSSSPPGPTTPLGNQPTNWHTHHKFKKLCAAQNTRAMANWVIMHAKVYQEPDEREKMLEYCAIFNKPISLDYLLKFGFLGKRIEESDLLIKAATHGSTKSVVVLLKEGFNPHLINDAGLYAFKVAARGGHYGTTKTLLKVGVTPNTTTHEELLESSVNDKSETLRLILEKYPKSLLEGISSGQLLPAIASTLEFVKKRGIIKLKKADELTKQIAEAILKDASKEKIQKYIQQGDNIIEI